MRRLTILYDPSCPVCVRCRDWLRTQPTYVELELLACDSADAQRRYGVASWRGDQLMVVADDGRAWLGPPAFLVCLWALRDWREWSYRLSSPSMMPLAGRFFHALSSKRRRLATWLGWEACTGDRCDAAHPYR